MALFGTFSEIFSVCTLMDLVYGRLAGSPSSQMKTFAVRTGAPLAERGDSWGHKEHNVLSSEVGP